MMATKKIKAKQFKWRHFEPELILWTVRWYCQFALSYRDLVLIADERGLSIAHTTIMRWVHQYAVELEKRVKPKLKNTDNSWRLDETYLKIKGVWKYLYRAVDKFGNTLDWMLSSTRNKQSAKKFFKKLLGNKHCTTPRVIGVDKNPAYLPAFAACQDEHIIPINSKLRQVKYLNNIQEQDHRFIKRRVRHSQWLQSFYTAKKTIAGYETMHMLRKGQVKNLDGNDMRAQKQFVEQLFGIAA